MADDKKINIDDLVTAIEEKEKEEEGRHNDVRESYRAIPSKVKDFAEFRKQIASYIRHHNAGILKGGDAKKEVPEMSEEYAFGHAYTILQTVFKDKGGIQEAYKMAKSGNLRQIIEILHGQMKGESKAKVGIGVLTSKIDPTDTDQLKAFATAVMEKYKSLVPEGFRIKPAMYAIDDPLAALDAHRKLRDGVVDAYMEKIPNYKKPAHAGAGHGGG